MTGRRVTVLVDLFPQISETFVTAEARALQALGVDVRIEATAHATHPDPAAARGLPTHVWADDGRRDRLAALAWLIVRAPWGCLRDLRDRRRWRREEWPVPLRVLAPAVRRAAAARTEHLHVHFGAGAALSTLRLARLLHLPYSVTLHGYDIFLAPRNLAEKLGAATFAASGSDFTVAHLRAAHPAAAQRIHRIVMGVDAHVWRRTTPHPTTGVVLAVGRLVEKKGLAHLVHAAALLKDEPAFSRLVVVGDGPLRGELDALIEALGLDDRAELLGALPSAAIRELLEEADVVAVPSVVSADGDADSMPVIAKEALAMEVPVVASDVAGLPEVVRPPWGRLVAPGTASALAAALAEVLRSPVAERAAMGAAGRAHVERECSVADEAARLLALIDDARGPGPPGVRFDAA